MLDYSPVPLWRLPSVDIIIRRCSMLDYKVQSLCGGHFQLILLLDVYGRIIDFRLFVEVTFS